MTTDGKTGLDIPAIRNRLTSIDGLMLQLLAERAHLVRTVGRIKHAAGQSLQASDREAAMFARMRAECARLGLDFDYIAELWSTMIHYAKVMECQEVGADTFLDQRPVSPETLRTNLLNLTEAVADNFDRDYSTGATEAYRLREFHAVTRAITRGLPHKELALDLGCATGAMTHHMHHHFDNVTGIDVSSDMCEYATTQHEWPRGISFRVHDLANGIPTDDGSVSFLVANLGSASEFGDDFLSEVTRVLTPGGRAILSYYNKNALLNHWFYPWPSTVRARLNTHNDTVEVWVNDNVYTLHAKGETIDSLQEQFRA